MGNARVRWVTARTLLALSLLLFATSLASRERTAAAFPVAHGAAMVEWPTTDGVAGAHYSSLADIRPDNVAALEVAWTYHTGDVSDGKDGRAATAFEATPVMVDGALYFSTPGSRVVALDAETGQERWS